MKVIAIVSILCSVLFATSCNGQWSDGLFTVTSSGRSITVDYDNDRFLLDGKPFRYISGSFHYFRATPESWRRIIRLMKAAGLNALSTYVEWSLHNPSEGEFNWSGIADLEQFIVTCKEEGMFVLLRPGPYICAERDLGGFPVWLLKKYPAIQLRKNDPNYLHEVEKWYSVLMAKMKPHLYGRGGNIILVQVENEYGSFDCDFNYTYWLRDLTASYVNNDALLYTTDGGNERMVQCGHINGTVQSIDFGAIGSKKDIRDEFRVLRKYYPRGPLINSEFYAGWLSHWEEGFPNVNAHGVANTLDKMLEAGVNVNFYMFFGGTNFGFTSGANMGEYLPQTTSYDYDAPLNEAGDVTAKYWAIRNVTNKYVDISMEVPENPKKLIHGPVTLDMSASLFNPAVRTEICRPPRNSLDPLDFEVFNQKGGLMIYEANLPRFLNRDPETLSVRSVMDRALVYIDRSYVGLLNRKTKNYTLTFAPNNGNKLQLIVEDQGRINYGTLDTWKGVREVKIDGRNIQHWNSTACPLSSVHHFAHLVRHFSMHRRRPVAVTLRGPTFFIGQVTLSAEQVLDTFMDVRGWSKGVAYVNGNNLGRYWSSVEPQKTLYVPKEFLKSGANEIILLEYQAPSNNRTVTFIDHPLLRGGDN